jgi:hypothetical protein
MDGWMDGWMDVVLVLLMIGMCRGQSVCLSLCKCASVTPKDLNQFYSYSVFENSS